MLPLLRDNRPLRSLASGSRECLAVFIFVCVLFPAAFATGAGRSNVSCQGTIISPTDDIVSIINSGSKNQTFCIEGEHRITSSIHLRSGQSLIGTTTNSRISGAAVVGPWQATSTQGVYFYNGPYAAAQPNQQTQFFKGGANVCYWVATYQDDLFFRTSASNDQRIMRVLSLNEVDPTQPVTTPGQAVTAGEAGRFFFDYSNQRIYLSLPNDQDPNATTVDLSVSLGNQESNTLLYGPGQNNVTLQNLFIEKGMNYGMFGGTSWTLKDMTIRFIHNVGAYNIFGATGAPATVDDTLFTNNGRTAMSAGFTANIAITNSEMSWNNIANFRATTGNPGSGQCDGYNDAGAFHIYDDVGTASQPAVTINKLWSHDNIGDGLWSDGGSQYLQITNSTFNGNERYGYLHEISCQLQFSNNTIYNNGYPLKNPDITGGGVNVSDSNYATFSSNLLYDNYAGFAFHLTFQQTHPHMTSNQCLGGHSDGDTSNALKYNQVVGNAIYNCSGDTSIGKVWGAGGTLNSRGNQYQSNHYYLADSTSNWFSDANNTSNYVPQDWNTWQQGNHDSEGDLTVGCTYVPNEHTSTTTALTLAPVSVNVKANGPVVATAIVKPTTGNGVPAGTVNFLNGGSQMGSGTLSGGAAVLNINPSALAAGSYSITATYLQDGNFSSSTSAPQTLSVQDFQIAASPTTVIVPAAGQSGTATLTIQPLAGFNQPLNYACSGLPSGATCTFTAVSPTTETVAIQTTAQSARLDGGSVNTGTSVLYACVLPGLIGIAISSRRRKRKLHAVRLIGLISALTVATLWMTACAGLSSGSKTQGNSGTQMGNSSVTVTAATSGSNVLRHTVVITLTVQ
jgi:hypothetical protein